MNGKFSLLAIFRGMCLLTISVTQALPVFSQVSTSWSANPDVVEKTSRGRAEFNYREAQVPEYQLPDPLVGSDGQAIDRASLWPQRRSQLMETFRSQVYGRRPATDFQVDFEQTAEDQNAFEGAAVGRAMQAIVKNDGREFRFPFVLIIPKGQPEKVASVVLINNRTATTLEEAVSETNEFWPVRKLIERGYTTAAFHTSDVDPDRADGYASGVRSFLAEGKTPADDDWRSLSAWGWAASKILDHLETLPEIDADQVAVVGHSRGGKTALWAAAEDERFWIAYSNNSGCGGAALSRRAFGETVARITTSFPHWFSPNFATYGNRESELPIDQHELIAMIAPRGVYVTSADEDLWADPKGEYEALAAASPVFSLLGEKAITEASMPGLNQPRFVGQTGYHIRPGGHGLTGVDWDNFLDFADQLRSN